MSRKTPRVSRLKLRKELLIAKSELNRAQLLGIWQSATQWPPNFIAGAKTIDSVTSAATSFLSGVRAFRSPRDPENGKPVSWLKPAINGAGLITSLCKSFRARGVRPPGKTENPER